MGGDAFGESDKLISEVADLPDPTSFLEERANAVLFCRWVT